MKRKYLFILILLFVMFIPGYVNAGGLVSSCSSINGNDVENNWGKRGANGQYTSLAASHVYYCQTRDQSTNYNSGGNIFELMFDGPTVGKYRLYCLNHGKNAPVTGTIDYTGTKIVGGPTCAFYKYNDSGTVARHNRIRYIHHMCGSSGCSTTTCTDDFITSDPNCGGSRKSSVVDNSNSKITIGKANFDNDQGDYYTYSFNVTTTGKVGKFVPSLSPSISEALITATPTGGSSVSSMRAGTIYVRIPKSKVSGSLSVTLTAKGSYDLSCTFKKFGLVVYSNGKSTDQRVAFRSVEEVTNDKTFNKSGSRTFTVVERGGTTTPTTTSLMINKYNMSGESLAGATFGLYSDNACTTSVDTGTTNEYGFTYFTVNKNTNYFVKELSAPEGYIKENSCRSVAVGEDEVDVDFYNNEKGTEIETGDINIKKVDQNGAPVAGASIALYAEPTCGDKAVLDETGKYYITTDSSGLGSFTVDTSRTYYVKEAITPYGYSGDTSCKRANAGDTITITNNKITSELSYASIIVKKTDATTGDALSGAEISLFYDNACTIKIADATGKSSLTTDSSGFGTFNVASDLTYYLKETKAPDGYDMTSDACKPATFGTTVEFQDEKLSTYQEVLLEKYDKSSGDALPGAIFGLYSDASCSTRVPDVENNSQAVTGSTGTATFLIDPANTYYVKEIVPPDGYLISDSSCKSISPGEAVAFFDDKIITYEDVKVLKTDADDGTKLSGAIFGLFSDDTCSTAVADKNGDDQINTNSEGVGTFTVDNSKTYYIKELAAPEGYEITDNSCKAASIGAITTFTDKKLVVEPTYKDINVKKKDADSGEALAGAAFGLYSDDSCTVDAFDKDNNSSVTTGSDGTGKFTVDDSKTYYIKEVVAPSGYNITDTGCKRASFDTTMEFSDTKIVVITYKDINVKKVDSVTNDPLSGAVFNLYYDSTCSTSAVDKDGNSSVTTGSTGIGKFSVDSSKEYYIKETKAPSGYNITDAGCKKALFDNTVTFADIKKIEYEDIRILKKDKDDRSRNLAGAVFGLYSDSLCSVSAVDYNGTSSVTTDGYGVASFKIEKGKTYYLKETKAPDGYKLSSSCVKANTTTEMEFDNELIPVIKIGKIVIKKTDLRTKDPIEGVVFRLYKSDKSTIATDHDGVAIPDLRTDSNGRIEIDNLEYGTYYLKEVSAPDAYIQEVELKEVRLESEVKEMPIENIPISVLFSKRDSVTDVAINGGKYRVTTKDGDLVEEFSIDDGVYTLYITPGEYKFSEVEAPANYVNASVSFDFKVDKYGVLNITSPDSRYYYIYDGIGINIVNDKEEKIKDVPKTGTSSNMFVIATAIILILGGTASIIIMKKGQFNR